MIELSLVDKSFRQSFGSCVLASYSIVANYFTGIPVQAFFRSYCRHYKIEESHKPSEQSYSEHFQFLINGPCKNGYQIILDLHANSSEPEFSKARSLFSAEFFPDASTFWDRIETTLLGKSALLNLTIGNEVIFGPIVAPSRRLACHSLTVVHDGASLHIRDTDKDPGQNIFPLSSLSNLKQTRDGVLYCKQAGALSNL